MSLLLYSTLEIITTVCATSTGDLFHQLLSEVHFKPDFSTKLQNISWKALVYSTVKA